MVGLAWIDVLGASDIPKWSKNAPISRYITEHAWRCGMPLSFGNMDRTTYCTISEHSADLESCQMSSYGFRYGVMTICNLCTWKQLYLTILESNQGPALANHSYTMCLSSPLLAGTICHDSRNFVYDLRYTPI